MPTTGPLLMAIEGGGTRTTAVAVDGNGTEVARVTTGPANQKNISKAALGEVFRQIAAALPWPDAIGIGLAGGWEDSDWRKTEMAAQRVWPSVPCQAANDLQIALLAAETTNVGRTPKVLVLSGTGSCCYARRPDGSVVKVGGWGHLLGDQGSGHDLGMTALRRVAAEFDRTGTWPRLGARLLAAAQLNRPNDLIDWAQQADPGEVAALAPVLFAEKRDRLAAEIIRNAAAQLAADADTCAGRLAGGRNPVEFVFAGGLLLSQAQFAARVRRLLSRRRPGSTFHRLDNGALAGALALARRAWDGRLRREAPRTASAREAALSKSYDRAQSTRLSPTEERNPRSLRLDRMSIRQGIRLMLREDTTIPGALLKKLPETERVVRLIATSLHRGGRLLYVGAGTSGRLGVLDASECPPTFQSAPEMVQGIIAGGPEALSRSVEGAEDDAAAGAEAVRSRGVGAKDTVVGIAASGTTPFVWGALHAAKQRKASTVLVCFNPYLRIPPALRPNVLLAVNTGPEILTGSTRLKAGTATKLLLNIFTTLSMVQLGKVKSNLMIDLNPSNTKLKQRAVRILSQLTGADAEVARRKLESCGWNIRRAARHLP